MPNIKERSTLELIQKGVQDTKELLEQKQYNLSMIKSRQTMEGMVKVIGERFFIIDGNLMDIIEELYEGNFISKNTMEHYHKIRMIGNKAVHENHQNPEEALLSYQLLTEEFQTFLNTYALKRRSTSSSSQKRRPIKKQKRKSDQKLLKQAALFVLIIIALILVIRLFSRNSGDITIVSESTSTQTIAPTTQAMETLETIPETKEELVKETISTTLYKTNRKVNVRTKPSTDSSIVTTLNGNTSINYLKSYNDEWSIILYNDVECYIATSFISPQ